MKRFVMGLEYLGTGYCGWQAQKDPTVPTIQAAFEKALSEVADEPILLSAAGRTDAGVHALGQVVHFDTHATRTLEAWTRGVNRLLPRSMGVVWVREASQDFHARFSALERAYRYTLRLSDHRGGYFASTAWCGTGALDLEAMRAAASLLVGVHDFSSFRGGDCQAKSPVRMLKRLEIIPSETNNLLWIDCEANSFLQHMVRYLVALLVQIGRGKRSVGWAKEILEARDRSCLNFCAPPEGLCFTRVKYPESFYH